jgi:4-hydroxybutyrate dehydrogenase
VPRGFAGAKLKFKDVTMIPLLQFPRVQFEFGAVKALPAELAALGVQRPLLVTDQGVVRCGVFETVRGAMPAGANLVVFDRIPENPTIAGVEEALAVYRAEARDGVVAVGGGSVIDSAKAVALLATHPGSLADYFGRPERVTHAVAPLLAIPTTAGTGSEASRGAGIHPTATSRSRSIGAPYLVPKVAICDPELTMTLPAPLTAATGLDALTHCVEGYMSTLANPPVDAIALAGIRRVATHVERATAEPRNRDARWQMMMAALEGGMSLAKGAGPGHAIANTLGDRGLHHGALVTLAMPAVLRLLERHVPDKVRLVGEAMGAAPGQSAADALAALSRRVGLPANVGALGYPAGDLDEMAADAAQSFFNLRSPYRPTEAEFKTMIAEILG